MAEDINDEDARRLRALWFSFIDTIEPHRAALNAYALRLTRNLWDAEDLVQETLLRAYAMTGRGDLHGETSPVANPKAYLFRAATHLYIDQVRRARTDQRRAETMIPTSQPAAEPGAARDGFRRLTERASPQERAAVVLKDVFDFTLEEIADQLRTTTGAVKTALHRGRERLSADAAAPAVRAPPAPADPAIVAFVEAFGRRDVAAVVALLSEAASIEVPGVGGGRGKHGVWAPRSLEGPMDSARLADLDGERVVVLSEGPRLYDILRLEGEDGQVTRITDYYFAIDTLAAAADALGLERPQRPYHQPPQALVDMIATTTLPWRSDSH